MYRFWSWKVDRIWCRLSACIWPVLSRQWPSRLRCWKSRAPMLWCWILTWRIACPSRWLIMRPFATLICRLSASRTRQISLIGRCLIHAPMLALSCEPHPWLKIWWSWLRITYWLLKATLSLLLIILYFFITWLVFNHFRASMYL